MDIFRPVGKYKKLLSEIILSAFSRVELENKLKINPQEPIQKLFYILMYNIRIAHGVSKAKSRAVINYNSKGHPSIEMSRLILRANRV